ncbi:hypothetical protein B7463_g8192, partial [Scytalidium lignicola]
MSTPQPSRSNTEVPGNMELNDLANDNIPRDPSGTQDSITKGTPYNTLRQLANIASKPSTPPRRVPNFGTPSAHRAIRRTPAVQVRTPGGAQRLGGSARRTAVLTPHGRAALRELELRRSGLTPGKDRRRSGRQQRETPRDVLRALSRVLAPVTQPIEPSPQTVDVTRNLNFTAQEDFDDGSDFERPRLSIPLGEEDDDSLLLPPPIATGLEDDNFTAQSIELPRRATNDQRFARLSRSSFGSIRSDGMQDVTETGLVDLAVNAFESSFIPNDIEEDAAQITSIIMPEGDSTENLNLTVASHRAQLASARHSDIRPAILLGDDNDTTFQFEIPPRDILNNQQADPTTVESSEEENDSEIEQLTNGPKDTGLRYSLNDEASNEVRHRVIKKKSIKISKHGIQYPSLPVGTVKKLATTFARIGGNSKAKISKDTLGAILQASDWFFEQASDDLGAYAKHAGRKTIDESDIMTLMSRQRQINPNATPFSLAQRYLPPELLQELRVAPSSRVKRSRQLERLDEEEED